MGVGGCFFGGWGVVGLYFWLMNVNDICMCTYTHINMYICISINDI